MAKPKQKVRIEDVLRLGQDGAGLKASMSRKRWKHFVKAAHKRGYTVRSAVSDAPDALKERTPSSLRKEAAKTIGKAYRPAEKELSTREASQKYYNEKLAADEGTYNTWLAGESGKLAAQARAADTALVAQQQGIRNESEAAMKAAQADSLQRMGATAGNVSDPNQSTALDQTAENQDSRTQMANQRELSSSIMKIGKDSSELSQASLLAQTGARQASRTAAAYKAMAEVSGDREKLVLQKAADATELVQAMFKDNVAKAQSNREFGMAQEELGQKHDALAADIADSNRRFRLETNKFKLDAWVSKNKVLADQAKLQLGYDQIASTEGKHAADMALRKWVEKFKAKKAQQRQDSKPLTGAGADKHGVTSDERDLYRNVSTALGLLTRMHATGKVAPKDMRQRLRTKYQLDDLLIDVAEDLRKHNGVLSAAGRAKARRLGIKHVGYFFKGGNNAASMSPAGPNGDGTLG